MDQNLGFNRYLVDQFLDDPRIRDDFAAANSPRAVLKVFEQHGIVMENTDARKLYDYIQTVLKKTEAAGEAGRELHL